jgi:DNA-binding NtrC family response regulator
MVPSIIGISQHIENIKKLIQQIAKTEENVLVSGERGVGKDLIAQNLYIKSKKVGKPFYKINCACVAGTALENEIFSYERNIPGDSQTKTHGVLEKIKSGVLFIDKIDKMPLTLQTKFIQWLLGRDCSPELDSERPLETNVWIIAATSRDLEEDILAGRFRKDLYCCLSTKKILLEPLRKRPEDIPYLIQYYVQHYVKVFNSAKLKGPKKKTIRRMVEYPWPDNIRELQSIVQRILIFGDNEDVFLYRTPVFNDDCIPLTDDLSIFDMSKCVPMIKMPEHQLL